MAVLCCPVLKARKLLGSLPSMEFQIADLFEAVVDAVPTNEALVCGRDGRAEYRCNYDELEHRANRVANALAGLGIGDGDHVGIHLYNSVEWIEVMLGLFKLRAVPVNVNYRYVADELAYLFADADLRAVVTDPQFEGLIEEVRSRLPGLHDVVVRGEQYEKLLAEATDARPDGSQRSADDLYLLYTGGTTGMPKGVMWRHEDIYFASLGGRGTPSKGLPALVLPDEVADRARRGDPIRRRLPLCPLMHGGAQWVALQTLLNGGTLVLDVDRHFDAHNALRLLADEKVELTMLIGDATARPLADALAAHPGAYDLNSLQVIASGGAIMSPAVKSQLQQLLPTTKVVDTFGASETGGQGRLSTHGGTRALRLVTDEHTAVFDDDLRPIEPGSGIVGKLARRGWIPLGYYKDPDKTAATFPVVDGVRWSVPGDNALVEADGTITLLGRGAMSINTGGEKVFPEEVEGAIKSHPAVFDALVVGVPDDRFGQRVAAVVSLRDGALEQSDEELAAHARSHISGYKVPRLWVRVDACRRLPTGKPDYAWARDVATANA
jgi:acyl-CoA synthetase (AMP-forming)/AMP-acid ligase II